MCSNLFELFFERLKSCVKDACPCLMESRKTSRELDDLRQSTFKSDKTGKQEKATRLKEKLFTIETTKKRANLKRVGEGESIEMKNKDGCLILEQCPWNTESSDLFLKVGKSVFLVHQFLLSIESEILKTIIDSVPAVKKITTMVTLNGYEADEIKMLLTFVYLPESEINDRNILTLLKLADELMIEELVIRCEDFLLATDHFSPIFLLNLASKYQLPSLEESAAIKASKIPGIEEKEEFASLNYKQKEKVLLLAKNRYTCGVRFVEKGQCDDTLGIEGRASKSPEIKSERKLHEREKDFKGRLLFLPEQEAIETTCEAAAM